MFSNSTKTVDEAVATTQPATATDPRVDFAHKIVAEAAKLGYRDDAVRIVQGILPGYQPEHQARAQANEYAARFGLTDPVQRQALVDTYLAGYDEAHGRRHFA